MASPVLTREAIWQREREFFNAQAAAKQITPIAREVLHRYTGELRCRYQPEFFIRLLGDVAGKTVLNVGCGEGERCILLAKLGAKVTGIDLSEGAVELARARAVANGVQCDFICGPIEEAVFREKFDFVVVECLLHHVIHDLDSVATGIVNACRGRIIMAEPVNLSPALRRLRMMVGTPEGTPDERPLEQSELDLISRHMPRLRTRHFRILTRIDGMLLVGGSYEGSSWPRRFAYDALTLIDTGLIKLPLGKCLSSVAVMWADV